MGLNNVMHLNHGHLFKTNTIDEVKSGINKQQASIRTSDWRDFWAYSVEILVSGSPTGHILTSSGFLLLNWGVKFTINSSVMIGNFPAVLNFNRLFLKLNQFICN
jgi:hypothetical protein